MGPGKARGAAFYGMGWMIQLDGIDAGFDAFLDVLEIAYCALGFGTDKEVAYLQLPGSSIPSRSV
jgi:hypothetical protein